MKNVIISIDTNAFEEGNEDYIDDLSIHMTRTYCRMRGKYFVCKYMQHGFKNKNIGKGIRLTLAIINNLEVRKLMCKSHTKTSKSYKSENIDLINDTDMYTVMEYACDLLLDESFVTTDTNNLFQE